ncbi:type IV pilus assembly protein PilV [Noviherbaspirillum humi]|uniref:Type IV pilus assembly protein PilV n=1 Tax=Noviherbaspirillum humi TaxID=1688639 RepID=A0A239DKD0_9BURK|nr:type IV pilus modification protein PilV [Noviherbaspirillum humi]SNS32104.1 type IV pilus assembly protein PilV [Noviherbaspirillum humi]
MYSCRLRGFTLIEVLVSILLLAIGVIGCANLVLQALRSQKQSGYRSAAVQLASEMADMVRNRTVPLPQNGGGDYEFDAARPGAIPPTSDFSCFTSVCDPDIAAGQHLADWRQRVASALPGARVVICRDSAPWDRASRKLKWSCDHRAGAPLVIKIGWRSWQQPADLQDGDPELALSI